MDDTLNASSFIGNGSGLTDIEADAVLSGTIVASHTSGDGVDASCIDVDYVGTSCIAGQYVCGVNLTRVGGTGCARVHIKCCT